MLPITFVVCGLVTTIIYHEIVEPEHRTLDALILVFCFWPVAWIAFLYD